MGGPALNPTIQRSTRLRSSHESAGWSRRYSRRAADLFAASAVNGGTLPSGDGAFQRLRLPPGEHEIELYLEGYEGIREMLYLVPGETYKIQHEMQLLSEGVTQAPRPEPLETPVAPPQPGLRSDLTALAEREGHAALHRRLESVDPEAAMRIEPRNVRRVVRALEVYAATGAPLAQAQRKRPPPYDALVLGLDAPSRSELYRRIDVRVERMLTVGWVEEVRRILTAGFSPDLPALSSMGYREIIRHLAGEISLEEVTRQIRTAHHRLARRQYAWFKPADSRIHWLTADGTEEQQAERVLAGHLPLAKATGRLLTKP